MRHRLLTVYNGATVNPLASVPWVAQWKFNNNGNDSIGANTLTNNNSATFTTGKLGGATGATQLTAASLQYWSIADNAALSMGDIDFTVCAWVYFDSKGAARPIVGKGDYSLAKTAEYQLEYSSGVDRLRFTVGNGTTSASVDANNLGSPSTGTWYCVIAWHDATANTINISGNNGTADSTSYSGGSQNTAGHFVIGTFATYLTNYMNGRIDNVAIAKSVLTAAQRTAFYNGGNGTETLT